MDEKAIMGLELSGDVAEAGSNVPATTQAETRFLNRREELDDVTDTELKKAIFLTINVIARIMVHQNYANVAIIQLKI